MQPRPRFRTIVATAGALALAAAASGAETGFESLTEGFHGETLEVDGITFSSFGDWFSPPGTGQIAAIDDASNWLLDADPRMSDYIQGNVLNINGFSSPGYLFCRFQSMEITTGQRETGASATALYIAEDPRGGHSYKANELVLELYLEGDLVASRGVLLDNVLGVSKAGTEYGASTVTIEDVVFDRARLTTRGPVEEGTFLGGLDNIILGLDTCRADLDGDGALTFFDFLAFQNFFSAGDPLADFDGDGSLTFFDFLAFQDEFAAGCP